MHYKSVDERGRFFAGAKGNDFSRKSPSKSFHARKHKKAPRPSSEKEGLGAVFQPKTNRQKQNPVAGWYKRTPRLTLNNVFMRSAKL